MIIDGGCYCGRVRYRAEGEPVMAAQCHCRDCQYTTGGSPNMFMAMPEAGFAYLSGAVKTYARDDLPNPVTREFCPDCGTHLISRSPGFPAAMIKIGTLDDISQFPGPMLALYTADRQPFHRIPEGIPAFERLPPMAGGG